MAHGPLDSVPEVVSALCWHEGFENAADFHFRLRPTLVAAADAAVWRRYGLELDRAQGVLSPELWAIVEPECEPPPDRRAPGPPLADIEAAVVEIERIRA